MTVNEIKQAMKKGVVNLTYVKKNGEVRYAKATTSHQTISDAGYVNAGGEGPSRYGYISYWDLEKGGWRCFDADKLLEAESAM